MIMSVYKIKKKTDEANNTEEIKFPISSVDGLEEALAGAGGGTKYLHILSFTPYPTTKDPRVSFKIMIINDDETVFTCGNSNYGGDSLIKYLKSIKGSSNYTYYPCYDSKVFRLAESTMQFEYINRVLIDSSSSTTNPALKIEFTFYSTTNSGWYTTNGSLWSYCRYTDSVTAI